MAPRRHGSWRRLTEWAHEEQSHKEERRRSTAGMPLSIPCLHSHEPWAVLLPFLFCPFRSQSHAHPSPSLASPPSSPNDAVNVRRGPRHMSYSLFSFDLHLSTHCLWTTQTRENMNVKRTLINLECVPSVVPKLALQNNLSKNTKINRDIWIITKKKKKKISRSGFITSKVNTIYSFATDIV